MPHQPTDDSFLRGMKQLLGMAPDAVQKLLPRLDGDALLDLTDAIAQGERAAARAIIRRATIDEERELLTEPPADRPRKPSLDTPRERPAPRVLHDHDDGSEPPAFNVGDRVHGRDDAALKGVVQIADGPGDTVGIRIDGRLRMMDRHKLVLDEAMLGMTGIPSLLAVDRMRQLAGLDYEPPRAEPVETEVVELPAAPAPIETSALMAGDPNPSDGSDAPADPALCATRVQDALASLEQYLPGVTLRDLPAVRGQLNALLQCLSEAVVPGSGWPA